MASDKIQGAERLGEIGYFAWGKIYQKEGSFSLTVAVKLLLLLLPLIGHVREKSGLRESTKKLRVLSTPTALRPYIGEVDFTQFGLRRQLLMHHTVGQVTMNGGTSVHTNGNGANGYKQEGHDVRLVIQKFYIGVLRNDIDKRYKFVERI